MNLKLRSSVLKFCALSILTHALKFSKLKNDFNRYIF